MSTETIAIKDPMEEAREQMERQRALALLPDTAVQLHQDVEQMGALMMRMGQIISTMQRRLDELEERQAKITISHGEVKRIQGLIRCRADEICRKYNLQDKDSQKIFRAAIKKDVLRRWQVKDLHDIPEAAISAVDNLISGWTNIRMVMERRVST
ncbi:MAG: hypothetical protein K6E17_06190 [Clostridiales bacterium]|nr:hypothetical protein [Clostridiales bacterium]